MEQQQQINEGSSSSKAPEEQMWYACPVEHCAVQFGAAADKNELRAHISVEHLAAPYTPFACLDCGIKSATQKQINLHVRDAHGHDKQQTRNIVSRK